MPLRTLSIATSNDTDIVMTRVFDAPRTLVFEALTRPELMLRWFNGPPGWKLVVCEADLRVGGAFRYVWRKESGKEMGMGGVFQEIVPPERIVNTEKFDEAWYPGEALNITVLTEHAGKTTLTLTVRYDSQEARDAVMRSGMDQGVEYSYDRLAEMLDAFQEKAAQA